MQFDHINKLSLNISQIKYTLSRKSRI